MSFLLVKSAIENPCFPQEGRALGIPSMKHEVKKRCVDRAAG